MKYRVIVALVVVACFAVFFQNCGMQVRFASTEGKLLAKNVGVESEGEPAVADQGGDDTQVDSTTPLANEGDSVLPEASATPLVTETADTTTSAANNEQNSVVNNEQSSVANNEQSSVANNEQSSVANNEQSSIANNEQSSIANTEQSAGTTNLVENNNGEVTETTSDDGGPLSFVCVLEGPGQSILLGYMDSTVAASKSTPDTVCTTQRGCMEIAKLKFPVKEAVEKAYCKSNKNVVQATEAMLQQMVDGN